MYHMYDNNQQGERYYTVAEAAKRLGVQNKTVRLWVLDGKFPGVYRLSDEPKSPYRIPESAIAAFEQNRKL